MAPFKMEEISSGLSLPTSNTPLEHLLPEAREAPPDTAIYHASPEPEDRAAQNVRVDARLQDYLPAFERSAEALPDALQLLVRELDRGRHLDLHPAQMLLDELLIAQDHLLQDLLPAVVREDLEEVPGRERHPLGERVYRPALLALRDLAAVEEQPQLLALLQGINELLEIFEDPLELATLPGGLEEGFGVGRDDAQAVLPRLSDNLGLEAVEGVGDQLAVPVTVQLVADNALGGQDHHLGDLAAHLAQGVVALALYLLAGALDDAVALLAGLPLGALAGRLTLLACLVQDLAGLAAGLLRLVYGLLYLRLAALDLVPDRRVDVAVEQEQEDREGDDLPEDQARVGQVEYACWV